MLATERHAATPLTQLSEEERMFQSTVRKFARERIAPHVREMDEAGVFRKDLLQEFFELGLMAIDVPEEYGGQGGTFFQSILAIEELARVDPSAAVIVDVQNTLFNNALLRWANEEQKRRYLPRLAKDTRGELCAFGSGLRLGRVRAGDARSGGRRPLPPHRAQALDHQRGRSGTVSAVRERQSGGRATRASRRFWSSASFPDSRSARKRTSWAFARLPPAS